MDFLQVNANAKIPCIAGAWERKLWRWLSWPPFRWLHEAWFRFGNGGRRFGGSKGWPLLGPWFFVDFLCVFSKREDEDIGMKIEVTVRVFLSFLCTYKYICMYDYTVYDMKLYAIGV